MQGQGRTQITNLGAHHSITPFHSHHSINLLHYPIVYLITPSHCPTHAAACTICAACPMEAPHEAACGHLGCGKCWTLQLAQHFCCAACKRPLRRQQLIRKHYAGES
eukprot:1160535-Pelagomonas_calceolata.AAC.18